MEQVESTLSQVSGVLESILKSHVTNIEFVVDEIYRELADFALPVSSAVLYIVVDLIDNIFDLYPDEWIIAQQSIARLNNWINKLIYDKVNDINQVLERFSDISAKILESTTKQLTAIDDLVTEQYIKRMFAVYGSIAELSLAINSPPAYLEGIIQDARVFFMSVSSSSGLSYYDVLFEWDAGLQRLLNLIRISAERYKKNPQQIKVDIESVLIKPFFEIYANRHREETDRINLHTTLILEMGKAVLDNYIMIEENLFAINNLFDSEVEPELNKFRTDLRWWYENVYWPSRNKMESIITDFNVTQRKHTNSIMEVIGRLDLGGDIIGSINFLPDGQRAEQLSKLIDTVISPFITVQKEITERTKKRITDIEKSKLDILPKEKPVSVVTEEISIPILRMSSRALKLSHFPGLIL